jgi:peptide/nickel transport system permease protein
VGEFADALRRPQRRILEGVIEFLSRRLAAALVTLFLATIVVFAVVEVLPGDPALVMLGTDARPDTLAALRAKYGFDQPLIVQYLRWIGGLLSFDLGASHAYGTPVIKLIGDRLAVTLPLAGLALGWAILVAVPLGVFAAWRQGRAGDWGVMGFTQIGISIPNFWFGIVLVLLFAVSWQIFPAGGFPGWAQDAPKSLLSLVLPAIALSLSEIAILTRVTRSAMLDTLREDYVRTARAKGASERTVLFRHALRNALIPVTTVAGLIAGFLVAGAVIIESVFRLPGVGQLVYDSINNRDLAVIKNVVILFTLLVLAVNLLVDFAYTLLDPRPRVAS